jgi:hypothetical protein
MELNGQLHPLVPFTLEEKAFITHWIGYCVGSRDCEYDEKKISKCLCQESRRRRPPPPPPPQQQQQQEVEVHKL